MALKFICFSITGIISGFTAGFVLDTIVAQINNTSKLSVNNSVLLTAGLICFNYGINTIANYLEAYFGNQLNRNIKTYIQNHDIMKRNKGYIASIEAVQSDFSKHIVKSFSNFTLFSFHLFYEPLKLLAEFFLINKALALLFLRFNIRNNFLFTSNLGRFLPYGLSLVLMVFEVSRLLVIARLYDEEKLKTLKKELKGKQDSQEANEVVAAISNNEESIRKLTQAIKEAKSYQFTNIFLKSIANIFKLAILFAESLTQPLKIVQKLIESLTNTTTPVGNISRRARKFREHGKAASEGLVSAWGSNKDLEDAYSFCAFSNADTLRSIDPRYLNTQQARLKGNDITYESIKKERALKLIDIKRDTINEIKLENLVLRFRNKHINSDGTESYNFKEIKYRNLQLPRGKLILIEGLNATGKSTFLKVLSERYLLTGGSQQARLTLPQDASFAFLSLNEFNQHFKFLEVAANFRATEDTLKEYSTNNSNLHTLLESTKTTLAKDYSDGQKTAIMIISAITKLRLNNNTIKKFDILVDEALSSLSQIPETANSHGARAEALELLNNYAEEHNRFAMIIDHNFSAQEKEGKEAKPLDVADRIKAYYKNLQSNHTTQQDTSRAI
ncbi:ATP-binding cassette domain-containing protein [Rickettsiales endosymbiont of Stachyamoeba lipophora]|uniref:ATP-binding cassette domain-containing protein n=1 Tax=Rickettsiales endosymbiont of Stachyamoeba lipophora TaxID=2486578 RepID=UPI0013DDD55C|nr:ATP-binding cassette domain-containing protein [Rickettsiales endosymbiont of Stachyamoeba lipophora]